MTAEVSAPTTVSVVREGAEVMEEVPADSVPVVSGNDVSVSTTEDCVRTSEVNISEVNISEELNVSVKISLVMVDVKAVPVSVATSVSSVPVSAAVGSVTSVAEALNVTSVAIEVSVAIGVSVIGVSVAVPEDPANEQIQ